MKLRQERPRRINDHIDGAGALQRLADGEHRIDQHQQRAVDGFDGLIRIDAARRQDDGDGDHRQRSD